MQLWPILYTMYTSGKCFYVRLFIFGNKINQSFHHD